MKIPLTDSGGHPNQIKRVIGIKNPRQAETKPQSQQEKIEPDRYGLSATHYKVELKASAARDLSNLSPNIQKRIATEITSLSENPRPAGVKKLSGNEELYRVRIGAYRVIYEIRDKLLVVLVLKIGHRREVYRRR